MDRYKIILGAIGFGIVAVVALIIVQVLPEQQAVQEGVASIPEEIKSKEESSKLEKDASKLIAELEDAVEAIDKAFKEP